ncbi:32903_t:CDS:2, partial [Racocetra persica]
MKEIKESIILNELKKYVELLDEHYLTLENKKAEGEDDNKLLLKVIKNVKKLIVRKSNQLTSLKEEESHDVAEFKKL